MEAQGQVGTAALAERIADVRRTVDALHADLDSPAKRARLARRVAALGAEAKSHGFFGMAQRIADAHAVLEAAEDRTATDDLRAVEQLLAEIPEMADLPDGAALAVERSPGLAPVPVCIVGDESLEALLRGDADDGAAAAAHAVRWPDAPPDGMAFTAARIDDPTRVRTALGPFTPELFVIDADRPGAFALVTDLVDDPRTELVPIVVVGAFKAHAAAQYRAIGAAGTFELPASAREVRATCVAAVEQRRGRTIRVALATAPTVAPGKWAKEPRDDDDARSARAEADIPVIADEPEKPEQNASVLAARRVLVADDDPVVTWFLADQLRKAGCVVDEAIGSAAVLERAFGGAVPELVFLDASMRGMDGVALCHAIHDDVATRDVPIVLLSWKQEELAAAIDAGVVTAGVSKGAPPEELVAKATELLAPRARLVARVRAGERLTGRVEAMSVARLVGIAQAARKTVRITLDDGAFTYELVVDGGALRRASRTSPEGRVEVGARAAATALGVTHGTYALDDADGAADAAAELTEDLLADAIGAARAMARAVSAARLPNVVEVRFDPDVVHCVRAMRGEARTILERLVDDGASPRMLLLSEEHTRERLEAVLVEMCRRGFVTGVREEREGRMDPAHSIPLLLTRLRARDAELPIIAAPIIREAAPSAARAPDAPSAGASLEDLDVTDVDNTVYAPVDDAPEPLAAEEPDDARADAHDTRAAHLTPPPFPAASPAPPASASSAAPPAAAPPTALSAPLPAALSAPPPAALSGAGAPVVLEPPSLPIKKELSLPVIPEPWLPPGVPSHAREARDSDGPPATSVTQRPGAPDTRARRVRRAAVAALLAVVAGAAVRWTVYNPLAQRRAAAAPLASAPLTAPLPPQGLLEVSAPDGLSVLVDGMERGRGPKLSITLSVGSHEVRTTAPEDKIRIVEIARGKVTHADLAPRPGAPR